MVAHGGTIALGIRYVGGAERVGFGGNTDIFGGVKEQLR